MKKMEVSSSSMLCLVSQEEMHCSGENTHPPVVGYTCILTQHTGCANHILHTQYGHIFASSESNDISQCTKRTCVCVVVILSSHDPQNWRNVIIILQTQAFIDNHNQSTSQ